jgi:hypothetical protein
MEDKLKKLPPKVQRVIDICAADWNVTSAAILSGTKVGDTARARRQVMQTLARQGYGQSQIARWLGLHPSSVNYGVRLKDGDIAKTLREKLDDAPCPDLSGEWAI